MKHDFLTSLIDDTERGLSLFITQIFRKQNDRFPLLHNRPQIQIVPSAVAIDETETAQHSTLLLCQHNRLITEFRTRQRSLFRIPIISSIQPPETIKIEIMWAEFFFLSAFLQLSGPIG